ncbi:MAG: DMT family transporter [Alphaproteobacteria bacterium]|nr:DMT family transporter [Alphaproteobacteria bacterium]
MTPAVQSTTAKVHRAGVLLAIAGAIAFSGKAIIVKLAYQHPVDAATLIMYRMLFALPLFLLMAWWAERQPSARGQPLTRRDLAGIVGLGFLGYYLSSYLDFLGLQYVSAGLERLILYLNPTLVLVLGWVLFRRPLNVRRVLAMAVSYSGILLVFGHEVMWAGGQVALGATLVFLSALTYSLYLIYSGEMVKRLGSLRLVGWASTVACLCCITQFALLRPLEAAWVPTPVIALSVLNAVVCTVAPVLLVMMALERIGPGLTSQTGMIGPMSTIAMGAWILDEPLNAWIGVGTLLVLGGVFMVSRQGAK